VLSAANFVVGLTDPYAVWRGRERDLLWLVPLNIVFEGTSVFLFLVFLERLADVLGNPLLVEKTRGTRWGLWGLAGACLLGLAVGVLAPPVAVLAAVLTPLPIVLFADLVARFRRATLRFLALESGIEPVASAGL